MSFLAELKRRNVLRVAMAYLVTAWLVAQIADLVLDNIESPDWVMQTIMLVLALGFPFALIFAWAFELTPEGLKKEKDVDRTQSITPQTGRKLDFMIIGILAVALGYFIWESRFESPPPVIPANARIQQTSSEVNDSTDALENETSTTSAKSIAVLPFVNMSSDAEQEYFSDGISEEILNSLAKVKELKVAGRTSSFAFKGENQDLRHVGQALGVEHILEGSVRKSGTKIRITAQLIQVDDGFHLWSESYDRELDDVFVIQDEIAAAILEQLKLHLLADGEQLVVASTRADSQAYDLYLLAKQRMYERTGPTIQSAVELLDQAIAIDPEYAPAYAQRGIAEILLAEGTGTYGNIPLNQALANSKLYLDKALQLDPELAEGWAGIGLYHYKQPVITDDGIVPLQKALELNPNLIDASNWLNNTLMAWGRPVEAKQVMEGLVERDPLYRPAVRNMVTSYAWFGEIEKAQAYLDRVRPLIPNDASIQSAQATIYHQQGHYAKALKAVEQAIALQPSNSVARSARGLILLDTQQWERLLDEGVDWQPMYALTVLGRTEEASLQAFERAEKQADVPSLLYFLNLTNRSAEAVALLEERWADLDAFERDFPPYGGLGYLPMLDVALAYSRTGNAERFDDAMQRVQRVNANLLKQGINHPVFFMGEAAHQALAGNIESSLEFLDKAVARGATSRLPMVLDWPQFELLQGDPRYEAIQARMLQHINTERAQLNLEPVI
jgi:TolB-like protein/Tfp pilus assembly protein PilF